MKTSRAEEIRTYILDHVEDNPAGIATQTAKKFKISRPGVHRHISTLVESGKLTKIGKKRQTRYAKTTDRQQAWVLPTKEIKTEAEAWDATCAPKLRVFKSNVIDLLQWGFCQLLNNSLTHGKAKQIAVFYEFSGKSVLLSVLDDGKGIFAALAKKHKLSDHRNAALQLMKGSHDRSIFWCSKIFDSLTIRANGLEYCRFGEDDWYLDNAPDEKHQGTLVQVALDISTSKTLASVLKPGGASPADKSHLFVKMLELEQAVYLTREDAKKLLFELEDFKEIVLDFKAVRNVGHSFVQEIFQNFRLNHPDTDITYVNTNANIQFMIELCERSQEGG